MESRRIVINLSPADTKKEGSLYDLPMAISILIANGEIKNTDLDKTIIIGELSLDGKVNRINGAFPITFESSNLGMKRIILPKENAKEASIVQDIEVIGVENLRDVIEYLNGEKELLCPNIELSSVLKRTTSYKIDFSDVKGQENVKRALEVAAAGGHNILLIRNTSDLGKTMLAKSLPSILPDLNLEEALEITKIHSIVGLTKEEEPLITKRPYRSPHHTISSASLVRSEEVYQNLGEISLSHNGVLFLDELTEFNKHTLELMRGPLEDRKVTISRLNASYTYPCNFMMIASMNPCPCGYYGSKTKNCTCSNTQINRYIGKISGPLLDRIDIHVEVQAVDYQKLQSNEVPENSETIKKRVNMARKTAKERYKEYGIYSNAELTPRLIQKFCKIDENEKKLLENAFDKLGFSARAYSRILKVARTIADLDGKENIEMKHLAEAINYRDLDKKYWKN